MLLVWTWYAAYTCGWGYGSSLCLCCGCGLRLRLRLVFQLRLWLWLRLWFEPKGGVCFEPQTTKASIEISCFSIYSLYPPDHPPGIERRQNLRCFKQKVVTSTKFRNFVWNHSGKEAMGSFLHIIPHTPPILEKRDPKICVFVTKSEGYKNKISKFCLVPLRQRGYEVGSLYIPHKLPPLEKRDSEIFMGINAEKTAPSSQKLLQ